MRPAPDEPAAPPEWVWNALVLVFYLPVAVGAVGWLAHRLGPDDLLARLVGEAPLRDLAAGAGAGLVVVLLTRLITRSWATARRMERAMAQAIGPISNGTCALLAVASAVAEELLFRGVLQPWLGLLPATALFAAAHVPVDRDLLLWPIFALLAGLLLGGLFAWTGALIAPVACHIAINFPNLRHLARAARL